MDLSSAWSLVKLASENYENYPLETQRSLLESIFHLADDCQEELSEMQPTSTSAHFETTLSLLKFIISDALKAGDLSEGFRQAAQCFWPAGAANFESPALG